MLEPQTRTAFLEELRPPAGFELSRAVGTTFSLDLIFALNVPLSLDSRPTTVDDPIPVVLNSLRRNADLIDIFAQAGHVRMVKPNDMTPLLEPMIHHVAPKRQGLFHPKVWLLEFQCESELRYRLLCASRNLTDDHSWDVLLRLDGEVDGERSRETHVQNEPLVRFLRSLSKRAVVDLPRDRVETISRLASRVRNVRWDQLDGAEATFHFIDGQRPYDLDVTGTDALIISPFISDDQIAAFRSGLRGRTTLLARPEQLDRLDPSTFDRNLRPMVLNEDANVADVLATELEQESRSLSGLHAKALIVHDNYKARLIVGSANATTNAYTRNVEMMVEFTLRQSQYGIDATIDALGDLAEPYATNGGASVPEDEEAAFRREAYCRELAGHRFYIRLFDDDPHGVRIWADPSAEPTVNNASDEGITFRYSMVPSRVVADRAIEFSDDTARSHPDLILTEISGLLELTATDQQGGQSKTIITAEIINDAENRIDAIVATSLADTDSLIRYLLSGLDIEVRSGADRSASADGNSTLSWSTLDNAALLEPLVRAVDSHPEELEAHKRVIDNVRKLDETRDRPVINDQLDSLWNNIWRAHQLLSRSQRG